jgi:hypothetical protein
MTLDGDNRGPGEDQPEPDRRGAAIAGLVFILVLVVAGYFLMGALHRESNLEDCLMSGRRNCAPIDLPRNR